MDEHKVELSPGLRKASLPLSAEEKAFAEYCERSLKKVMIDHDLTNIKLANLAKVGVSQVSRLRNGNLSQRNYIKIVRGLPRAARKEYLAKVFDLEWDKI